MEGTGSYGSGLARFLRRHGHTIIEVSRPPLRGERRRLGKSDAIDAEHAARAVLAGTATATPKLADGLIEVIRLVKVARDTAVKARTQAMITLKTTLVTAADSLRAELEPLSDLRLIQACAQFVVMDDLDDPTTAMRHVLGALARHWLQLDGEILGHSRHLRRLTATVAPQLVATFGIGPDSAAELLVAAGDRLSQLNRLHRTQGSPLLSQQRDVVASRRITEARSWQSSHPNIPSVVRDVATDKASVQAGARRLQTLQPPATPARRGITPDRRRLNGFD